jgi:hypothetical protein
MERDVGLYPWGDDQERRSKKRVAVALGVRGKPKDRYKRSFTHV